MCLSPRMRAAIQLKAHVHSSPRPQGQTPSSGPWTMDNVAFNYVSDTPLWELERPNNILELATSRKSDTPPMTYHDQYLTIRNRFPRHIPFYTDGSKDTERFSVAAVLINHSYGHRIQDHSSIFTAKARAILLALECIEHSTRKRFLIFTDSISCLQALNHLKIDHPIIEEIISKLMSLKGSGFDIHLCWLPGHFGIPGKGPFPPSFCVCVGVNAHVEIIILCGSV